MIWAQFAPLIRVGEFADRPGPKESLAERFLSIRRELGYGDRAVESDKPGPFVNSKVHRRDVTVAEKYFGIVLDNGIIDFIEQVRGTITASNGKNGFYVFTAEHFMEIIQTGSNRTFIICRALADMVSH